MTNLFVIINDRTGLFARHDSVGEHDGKVCDDIADAREFASWGDASDYSQNFGPDFRVMDVYGDVPRPVSVVMPRGHWRSYRHAY